MDQHISESNTQQIALRETIAEERINLGLRNIDQNLMELTQKLRKPVQQVHYVQENWRRWSRTAFIAAGTVAGIWIGYKVMKKVFLKNPTLSVRGRGFTANTIWYFGKASFFWLMASSPLA